MNNYGFLFSRSKSLYIALVLAVFSIFCAGRIMAQGNFSQPELEEMIVTGTHIRGTPVDTAAPVSVINREELEYIGSPSVNEIIRNLGVSSGVDGEANPFGANGLMGTSNVNIRGLGAGRTLVLLNGRRQTFSPRMIADQQMLFVDTNQIPSASIQRIEVLKDGAAATYGSDAIAGVVNFITRENFEGLELSSSYKYIDDSDGDYDIGMIFGVGSNSTNWVTSLGFNHRSVLPIKSIDYALRDFEENPQGGWSSISSPVTFVDMEQLQLLANPDTNPTSPVFVADPTCEELGGILNNGFCNFQYTTFYNVVEEEDRLQLFSELKHEFSENLSMHLEFLYAKTDVDEWNGSPSYPPQSLIDPTNRLVLNSHPGWQDMISQFPSLAPLDDALESVIYIGRVAGVGGPAQQGNSNHETYRLALSLTGNFSDSMRFDSGIAYSRGKVDERTSDVQVYKLRNALLGYGGSNCDVTDPSSIPGENGCEYFNPFSNAIPFSYATGKVNPYYNAEVGNSDALMEWLFDDYAITSTTELLTADLTVDGESELTLPGGNIGYAVGIQYRYESYERDPNDLTDLTVTPCITPGDTSCSSPTGPFGFVAGTNPLDENQDIYSVYSELSLPITDSLNLQLALRYEDYGGDVGDTTDPKLAFRWQMSDAIALRGSTSTTFRGPTLNQLNGTFTTLSYIPSASAFKAVDTVGNSNLDPETAKTFNIGIIADLFDSQLFATLDYWNFDFEDPIIVEPYQAVLSSNLPGQVIIDESTGAVERVIANIVNGPNIKTDGIDLTVKFTPGAMWTLGFDATYVNKYDVDNYVVDGNIVFEGFSAVGQLNSTNFVRPLPRIKAKIFAEADFGQHSANMSINYVHSYNDERAKIEGDTVFATIKDGKEIDSYATLDISYNYQFNNDKTHVNLSISNLTDEDPPFARLDINYDPFTHNPLNRTLKLTVTHRIW